MKSNKKMIFILGVAHSGTTILYNIMSRHPDIIWFSQFSMRGGEIPKRKKFPFYNLINRIGEKIRKPNWKKNFGILTKIFPTPMEPHKIWDYILPRKTKVVTEAIRKRARNIIYKEINKRKKDVFVTKLPRLTESMILLAEIFPEAKFIHIVRDGKAVSLSNKHKFQKNLENDREALEKSCKHWEKTVLYIKENSHIVKERFLEFKYEDFCDNLEEKMNQIYSFIDIKKEFNNLPKKLKASNKKHFDLASSEEKDIVNEFCKEGLIKYDYKLFKKQND